MRLQKLLLLALLITVLPACGAAGEDSHNSPPNSGPDGDANEPIYPPDVLSGPATFYVDHSSGANDVPPGDAAKGFASAHTSEGLMRELNDTGTAGGLLRHDLRVNIPRGGVPTSLLEGERIGL
ncbi:MAG: hypothetical protein OSB63_00275 [Planctomycetota bacterium]|nr:hypothetical protein [Planctomycetota bacterium]